MTKSCYACDQPATTREHVPPFSFFPEGHRNNLITVPSCALHNNANAMDVEYTRNVVSLFFGVNDVGERHFLDKAMRSFDHTPALLHTTFSDIRPVKVQGVEVGVFTTDVKRVNAVMSTCLTALHFEETGEKMGRWEIVLPNMGFTNDTTQEKAGAWRQFLSLFSQMPFQMRVTGSPDVFQYAVADIDGGRVYSMRFYKAFLVFGFRAVEVDAVGTQPE
jgi:hypothetical protein